MPKVLNLDALIATRHVVSIADVDYRVQPVNALILETLAAQQETAEPIARLRLLYDAAAKCLPDCPRVVVDSLTPKQLAAVIELAQEQVDAVKAAAEPAPKAEDDAGNRQALTGEDETEPSGTVSAASIGATGSVG